MKIAHCNCSTLNRNGIGPLRPVQEKGGFCVHCDHAVVYSSTHDRFPRAKLVNNGYRPVSQTASVWLKHKMDMELFHTLMSDAYPEQTIELTELAEDLDVPAINGFRRK